MHAERGHGRAPARGALAGNPSDGYGGAVVALALRAFEARATAVQAAGPSAEPPSELVSAAIGRFARTVAPAAADSSVSWSTTIPRCVGLGGSSAIVIATIRALCELYGASLELEELVHMALAVEVEDLGVAAGPQDRVAQASGGLTFMDFSGEQLVLEALDPAALSPLLVAWRADAAADSGPIHGDLRRRFERGDAAVHAGMRALAEAARSARVALIDADHARFAAAVDATFDARRSMLSDDLDPRHVGLIELARACGAAANYAGSGGAIVAVCAADGQRAQLAARLRAEGCAVALP